ncbi:hypothetical protein [Pseudomonas sp. S2_C03]
MVNVEGIVNDRDDDAFTLSQCMGSLDIGAGIDLELVTDDGFFQMPLVVMDRPSLALTQHFRVAILDVPALEQLSRERAHLRAMIVLMMNEESVCRVGRHVFDLQIQCREDFQASRGRQLIDELQEHVFGVENRFPGERVHQYAAGETYVGQLAQHGFAQGGIGLIR